MSSSTGESEAEADRLVVWAKADREAMGRLYDRYYPVVHRYASRRLLDAVTVEDVTSEVFLHVAANMGRFAGTTDEDFRCWVYRIATNAINAHLRKRIRRNSLFTQAFRLGWWGSPGGAADPPGEPAIEWEAVAQALHELSAREQTTLSLRYMEGLTFEAVGNVIGARPATVRVIVSRALEKLRRRLTSSVQVAVHRPGEKDLS